MATENGRGLQNALQATIDRYLQTEGPKIGLIHRKLEELRGLLADEQITEEQFFRRLIDETEPIRTFVCICGETFQLERTSESQIIISPQSTANSDYYVVAVADFDQDVKRIAVNLFMEAQSWGLFNSNAESLKNIAKPGEVSIIDVSCYATLPGGWNVKSLVIGLIAEKLFEDRMKSRKFEELEMVQRGFDYFKTQEELTSKEKMPLVWLVIDEAHEFLPKDKLFAISNCVSSSAPEP